MVAVSDSAASRRALRWAAGRASSLGAVLRIVTAIDPPAPTGPPTVPSSCYTSANDLVMAGLEFQRHLVESTVGEEAHLVRISHCVGVGPPYRVIRDASTDADLVVLGSARRRRSRSLFRRCRVTLACPVVVVADDHLW